eukprot:SAG31_NODE_6587_length_1962_cov_1.245303_3_plen_104_part_01
MLTQHLSIIVQMDRLSILVVHMAVMHHPRITLRKGHTVSCKQRLPLRLLHSILKRVQLRLLLFRFMFHHCAIGFESRFFFMFVFLIFLVVPRSLCACHFLLQMF